ncbi:hypothetical protein [Flavobacterium sp. 3HN19-14]|uniref:hypothetical protein n=1 Tax=Flavobacterium sp. 3HN19-14 TaxID=3448133 RepID=UPI003EE0D0B9
MMTFCATVMPFTLFFKRLRTNFIYVLLISFLMKIGAHFERFVIIVTSYHRDFSPFEDNSDLPSVPMLITMMFLQGFVLAVIVLLVVEFYNASLRVISGKMRQLFY